MILKYRNPILSASASLGYIIGVDKIMAHQAEKKKQTNEISTSKMKQFICIKLFREVIFK